MDNDRPASPEQVITCADMIHRVCSKKSRKNFFAHLSTIKFHSRTDLPVEKQCGTAAG